MSRRFGRNQRRRAREAVALAEEQAIEATINASVAKARADTLDGYLRINRAKIQGLEAVVEGVRQALGENSVLLDPLLMKIDNTALAQVQFQDDLPIASPDEMMLPATISIGVASVLNTFVRPDNFARRKHFMLQFRGETKLVYAIDDRALMQAPVKLIERRVARELARQFVQDLRGGR